MEERDEREEVVEEGRKGGGGVEGGEPRIECRRRPIALSSRKDIREDIRLVGSGVCVCGWVGVVVCVLGGGGGGCLFVCVCVSL